MVEDSNKPGEQEQDEFRLLKQSLAEDQPGEDDPPAPAPLWSQVWQMPVLLMGLVLFAVGLVLILPKPAEYDFPGTLDAAEKRLNNRQYGEALAELHKIRDHMEQATSPDRGRYWLLHADLDYLLQRQQGDNRETANEDIIDYYNLARQDLKRPLGVDRAERYINTLVALDRTQEALQALDQLGQEPPARRYSIIRTIIERRLQGGSSLAELTGLLKRFREEISGEKSSDKRFAQKLWIASIQGQAMLDAGDPREAIKNLTMRINRFKAEGFDKELAPLFLLLAKALQQTGEHDEARLYYQMTQSMIDSLHVLNADVLVGMGQLELAQFDNVQRAQEYFTKVTATFPNERPYLHALMGRGECEAKLGLHSLAQDHFHEAVNLLLAQGIVADPRRGELVNIVSSHYALNFEKDRFELAIEYLKILEHLYEQLKEPLPVGLVLRFAVAHKQLGLQLLRRVEVDEKQDDGLDRPTMSRGSREQIFQFAAIEFRHAGDFFRQHAEAMTVVDDKAHGLSLWEAAQAYDRAQLWDLAIEVYSQFVKTRASDQYFVRALHRLGMAYQAQGQHQAAIDKFDQLLERHEQQQIAFESLVPQAHSHIALGNFKMARRRLESVVNNHPAIGPDSPEYRKALVTLSKLHYRLEQFNDAIARFHTAADRYKESEEAPMLRFYLADSYRRSTEQLDDQLNNPLPQSVEQQFRRERRDRLRKAQDIYHDVIPVFENLSSQRRLSQVEQQLLRNTYFYRADCAYLLENWSEARSLYDEAAKRWDKHPASLIARVQIVNTYAAQGMIREARIANDQAREQLKQIPEDAFDDPTLPMSRQHWRQWLQWTSRLDLNSAQASVSLGEGEGIGQ